MQQVCDGRAYICRAACSNDVNLTFRIGQKKPVHVYQLIAENTVESKVIEIQERKKLLIKQVRFPLRWSAC